MKLETAVGKLYTCSEYHLLVFPTEETAPAERAWAAWPTAWVPATAAGAVAWTAAAADWWSKELKCRVTFMDPGVIWMALTETCGGREKNGYRQVRMIAADGRNSGWINVAEWMKIEEISGV